MLREEDITIQIKSQGYECKTYTANVEGTEAVLLFESRQRTADMRCPVCGSTVHIYDSGSMNLRDMPIWVGCKQELCFINGLKSVERSEARNHPLCGWRQRVIQKTHSTCYNRVVQAYCRKEE